ncbi:MAG TPA: M1 family aminopeptidase [Gemmatimonadaceae bacterium]|nr:M1 family aminopeptidase [Gemmatimonadaceae bacterium]
MLIDVARFELRYLLRNPLLWITAALTFAAFFLAISLGLEMGSEGGLLQNAAYATLRNCVMTSVAFLFVSTAFVANAVIRDDETGFGPIVHSTRVRKADYLLGRFLGAVAAAALCMALVSVGIWLGSLMPWADPAGVGPNRLIDHLYAYFLVALPNLFIQAAIFFALATITRSMMATYLGVVGFVSGFFVLQGAYQDRPRLQTLIALADPFGARALQDAVRYWTVAERNVALPEFSGALLYNRLLWVGIAVLSLVLAHAVYRVADVGISTRARQRRRLTEGAAVSATPIAVSALPAPRHGAAALRALLWMRTRFEVAQVVRHPAFAVLMAWGMYVTGLVLLTQRDPDGKPTHPTTLSLIPEIADPISTILLVIVIYYAGELVWRERDRRIDALIDATPMPGWAFVVPKTLAMGVVLLGVVLASVAAAVLLQLSLGFAQLELGKYLLWYVLPTTWDMLLLAALAILVQALSPHKAVGWGVMVLFVIWQQFNTAVNHNLLLFGGTPSVPLSDVNGAGSFWKGAWVFRAYWGAFAALLLVTAHLMWRRGTDVRLRPRLANARRRLAGAAGWVAGGALLAFGATGAYAYHNTNVLNTYRTSDAAEAQAVAYERRYGKYAGLPQPKVVDLTLDVALYPEERRVATKGRLVLRNFTARPIPDVHVRVVGEDLQLAAAAIAGAQPIVVDSVFRYRIFRLDRPMQPGEERVMTFETRLQQRGFRNEPTFTRLVENGSFLSEGHLMPFVGLFTIGTVQDSAARRRHGLPPLRRVASLDDLPATENTTVGRGWARSDITVSTSADQVPLAPGNKVSDVVRDGRRVARFVSSAPMHPRFSIQSARFAERHRRHGGVDLAVYHHPGHAWNVDRMLDALAASLDYYRANFGPYPFDHARIVEFPGYQDFAQAFAGTIPVSEDLIFVSDTDQPRVLDYVTYLTAHELAHQYWAHQVVGADMEGREVLSETLSQYSALMVLKRRRGEAHIRRYLQYELDRYLGGRANDPAAEPPLARVTGQDHVTYSKGALAMYLLQVRLGEAAINRALRTLLARHRFRGAPYPRSLDLVAALRAEARTAEDRALIGDLFERIALWDLQVGEPTAARRADGRWDVTVPVEARKLYVEGGVEREAPLADRIEVGLFTAEPGDDGFGSSNVLLLERHRVRSGRQVLRFVTAQRPTHAGIDPYNYYLDRTSTDNVRPVP